MTDNVQYVLFSRGEGVEAIFPTGTTLADAGALIDAEVGRKLRELGVEQ